MEDIVLRPGFRDSAWLGLAPDARRLLLAYASDLLRFNGSQNLVSRAAPGAEIARLLEESVCAAIALASQPDGDWLDVGSGGGLPGLPLACVHSSRRIDLVERRQGRCDFLRREVAALGLSQVRVVLSDVQALYGLRTYSVVCAKAVAEPGVIEALCDPVIAPGGSLVLFQRAGWLGLGDRTPGGWRVEETWPGLGDEQGLIVREGYRLVRP